MFVYCAYSESTIASSDKIVYCIVWVKGMIILDSTPIRSKFLGSDYQKIQVGSLFLRPAKIKKNIL